MTKSSVLLVSSLVKAIVWGSVYFACLAVVRRPTLVVPRGK